MKVGKKAACFLLGVILLAVCTKKQVDASVKRNVTLFIIGDSTSKSYHEQDKATYPREGWGQELPYSFQGADYMKRQYVPIENDANVTRYELPKIGIENWGKSGATIKSCNESKRFKKMLSRVRAKDYVMIQFGHNDARKSWGESPNEYERYLVKMTREIKAKGAVPVFVTSLPQYSTRKYRINAPKYRKKMLHAAKTQGVFCIDLNEECVNYFNLRGKNVTRNYYMFLKENQYKSYPKGLRDSTHFRKQGAAVAARIVAVKMQNNSDKRLNTLTKNLNMNSKSLYKALKKTGKYKKRKYTSKSWRNLEKARKQGWITLYSPKKGNQDYKKAEKRLKKAKKNLRKRKTV